MRALLPLSACAILITAALHGQDSMPGRDPWIAPAPAAAKVNPLATRPDAVAGGSRLFHERCSECHGADARGTSRAPDLTSPGVQAQSDGALFWKISSGDTRAGMPTFSFLPELQRWQLVLHVRLQRGAD